MKTLPPLLLLSPLVLSSTGVHARCAQAPAAAGASEAQHEPSDEPLDPRELEARLRALEQRFGASETALSERDARIALLLGELEAERAPKPREEHPWYERIRVRGYTQLRLTSLFGQDNTPDLHVPADRSVGEEETFLIRRGRLVFSGDVADRLALYAQIDLAGSVGGDVGVQARDLYGDIALDAQRELRVRVGLSKIPFGFVNLQSSQNRAALERPDALNSGVEGERDTGVIVYWAPSEIRERFKKLANAKLKGSGDYGVLGFGAYTGQGPNRSDRNEEVHWVARASYPFELGAEQIVELGAQAYTGELVPSTAEIGGNTPSVDSDGVRDERVGLSAVLYPQPFGVEAEWNWGRGPELERDFSAIGSGALQGGYVQAGWRIESGEARWFPFTRWNHYDGARKLATNAPWEEVEELDLGVEWSPFPAVEVTVAYTHTFRRTNTSSAPYDDTLDADRVGFQVQVNY